MRIEEETRPTSELIKFGLLIVILLGAVVVVALARPFIFGHVVPAVLGENAQSAPLVTEGDQPLKETPVVEESVVVTPAATAPMLTAEPETAEATPAPLPEEFPTAAPTITHVVQRGENLTAIARTYNVPIESIVTANGISNPNHLQAGTVLIIPQP